MQESTRYQLVAIQVNSSLVNTYQYRRAINPWILNTTFCACTSILPSVPVPQYCLLCPSLASHTLSLLPPPQPCLGAQRHRLEFNIRVATLSFPLPPLSFFTRTTTRSIPWWILPAPTALRRMLPGTYRRSPVSLSLTNPYPPFPTGGGPGTGGALLVSTAAVPTAAWALAEVGLRVAVPLPPALRLSQSPCEKGHAWPFLQLPRA